MALDKNDIELIKRTVFDTGNNIAIEMMRSFERLEERIDAAESRLYSRFAALEDRIAGAEQQIHDDVEQLHRELLG